MSVVQHRCPYLGLYDDPETWCAFPAPENYCHRPATPQRIALAYQLSSCLSAEHVHCPVYQAEEEWHGPLPRGIRAKSARKRPAWAGWGILLAAILILLLSGAALFFLPSMGFAPRILAAPTATPLPSATPTVATDTPTPLPPTPSPTSTKTPAPSPSPSPTFGATATSTAQPTATPEGAVEAILAFDTNLRSGPGTDFDVITLLEGGSSVLILARDALGTWLFVHTPTGDEGWVFASQVEGEGLDILRLPTGTAPPPATSATPTP